MIRPALSTQQGFSAVELLITLFVAATFIATGYQLYSIIIKDGGDVRQRAKASNIAYENMRRYSAQATSPCTAVTPSPAPSIPANSGLESPSITVTISCPYGTGSPVSKVEAVVRYGAPQQEVAHAVLVNPQ